jgi:hypothetical protein
VPGEEKSYTKVAKKHGVSRTTLARRHKGIQETRATEGINRRKLDTHQGAELVQYIGGLTQKVLPPTRTEREGKGSTGSREG